jgi:hypothetical protein
MEQETSCSTNYGDTGDSFNELQWIHDEQWRARGVPDIDREEGGGRFGSQRPTPNRDNSEQRQALPAMVSPYHYATQYRLI